MTDELWAEGDLVSLLPPDGAPLVTRLARGAQRVGEGGVVDLTAQIGVPVGGEMLWLGTKYRVVRPSLSDLLGTLRRGAQIVLPKDAAQIVRLAGVAPGAQVAEAGSGSGALTLTLAHAVGPPGRVVSYDRRRDFLEQARSNVQRAGFGDRVEFIERDVAVDGFDRQGFGSVVLDLPEPWAALRSAHVALRVGGYVATFMPTYNQLERTVRGLREVGFGEVRSLEMLERGLHVGDGGTRPEFEMLGHTGFLAAGRRTG